MVVTDHHTNVEFPGHVGAALVAYSPIAFVSLQFGSARLALVGGAVTVAFASLPDADSYGPRMTHRGYSHTVWFAGAVGVACALAFAWAGGHVAARWAVGPAAFGAGELAAFGFVVGATAILSHLAVDALTPMGVAPFAPVVRRRYSLGVTRSADPVANRRLLLLGVATTGLTAVLGTAAPSPVG